MQWTTNSGEAVPGLAGLTGTLLVSCLILLVLGVVVGVIAAYVGRKSHSSEATAGAMLHTARVAGGAAVLGGAGALVMSGSTLYQVPKVEAQRESAPSSSSECSEPRSFDISSGMAPDDKGSLISDEWDRTWSEIYQAEVQYWPDPGADCADGTVDSCRMIHVSGETGSIGGGGFESFDEWVKPSGECSTGDPEEVEFS